MKFTQGRANRLVEDLRLLLTFIDANISPEITEPCREGRMSSARAILHKERTEDYGEVAFALMALVDVMTNYTGRMVAIKDAFDVLCEIGLMEQTVEEIKPGHPLYGKTGLHEGVMISGDPSRFNKPMANPDDLETICHAIAKEMHAERVIIDKQVTLFTPLESGLRAG